MISLKRLKELNDKYKALLKQMLKKRQKAEEKNNSFLIILKAFISNLK
jgi:hypothetical protein